MAAGHVTLENRRVHVTGEWPARWRVATLPDFAVFCAFVFEQARAGGAGEAAVKVLNRVLASAKGWLCR